METSANQYDIEKSMILNLPKLNEFEIKENLRKIVKYYNENNNEVSHFMLLCKEKSDYTVFETENTPLIQSNFVSELKELLLERGNILAIREAYNEGSFEFWIKNIYDGNIYMYMLFPYDWGVIIV